MAKRSSLPPEHDNPAAVRAYLEALTPSVRALVDAVRSTILGCGKDVTEGIKWNSPSFYCNGWFATVNLRRGGDGVQVVLHQGAKTQPGQEIGGRIRDPEKLLTWRGADRALVSFDSVADFETKRAAFAPVVAQWAAFMQRQAAASVA
jgi:hypothetical protein